MTQPDLTRILTHQLSHRRTVDPITFAKRVKPFLIERVKIVLASKD